MRVPFARSGFVLLCALASVLPMTQSAARAAAAPVSASQVVEDLHETLTSAMKQAEALGYQGRFDLIGPAVARSIDRDFMASKSIGRYWKKLTEAERGRWLETFGDLLVANYAGRFKGYSGESFTLDGEEDAPHDTKLVRTTLVLPEDDNVNLNYRLRETTAGWRIIDVYLNGTVSELALRRSEYSSTVKRNGIETLITAVEKKVADLAMGEDGDSAYPIASSPSARP